MPGLWDYIRNLGQPTQPLIMRRGLIPGPQYAPGRVSPVGMSMNDAEAGRVQTRRQNLPAVQPDKYASPELRAEGQALADYSDYRAREEAARQAASETRDPERPLNDQEAHRVEKNLEAERSNVEREKAYRELMKHLGGK